MMLTSVNTKQLDLAFGKASMLSVYSDKQRNALMLYRITGKNLFSRVYYVHIDFSFFA